MSEVPVKVFIRVRPLLGKELLQSDEVCLQVVGSDQLVLGRDRVFTFDGVFQADSSQSRVYEECVQPLVGSCLDGYNVTVLAYGQTGSGKSYTMGSEDTMGVLTSDRRGIIPRSLEDLFNWIVSKKAEFQHTVHVSYLEIYKEELRDLLLSGGVAEGVGPHELHIRETEGGHTVVMGVCERLVCDAEEALSWLGLGNTARITAATKMNQRSSRSHALFTVHIRQRGRLANTATPTTEGSSSALSAKEGSGREGGAGVSSKFHFVDLAGSERASKTGNQGERFKESVHINTGLLALGNVISALSDPRRRVSHVPYRDSKITRLLKDSLGGNTSTVMITCLSPASANFAENLNSLKYSKRARKIQNRPVINHAPQSGKVEQMREEIALLREELLQARRETQLLASSKPSSSASGEEDRVIKTGSDDDNVVVENRSVCPSCGGDSERLNGLRNRLAEVEEGLNQSNLRLARLCQCLWSLRGKMEEVLGRERVGKADLENLVSECLELVRSCENLDGDSPAMGVALPDSRDETISRLRAELESCRADLKTDEQAFAEKVEEIAELQSMCGVLSREKARAEAMWVAAAQDAEARAEAMWLAAQDSEAQLQRQVEELQRRLSEMGGAEGVTKLEEGVVDDKGVAPEEDQEGGVARGVSDETPAEMSEDSLSETQPWGAADLDKFEATRSLMRNKVKTDSLEAFSEVGVLNSLRVLTGCLVQPQHNTTLQLQQTLQAPEPNLGDTRIIHGRLPLETIQEGAESALSAKQRGELPPAQTPPPQGRPLTPLEPSPGGPLQSSLGRGGMAYEGRGDGRGIGGGVKHRSEMELLNESAMDSKYQLMHAEDKLNHAQEELRCLTIKIKLKEELIRELGKSSRSANRQGELYRRKIQALEQEAGVVKEELARVQALLLKHQQSSTHTQDSQRIILEHQKKLALTEKKLTALQKKQKETERLASYGVRSERRIEELESGIERLRNQQDSLRRKLKQQAEKKTRLENDLQKYQHRIKTLQTQSEQQKKVLRVKTEEAAAAQRKLRILSGGGGGGGVGGAGGGVASRTPTQAATFERAGLQTQREWLEREVEKVLEEKKAIAALEKDLEEREKIVREKEALVSARDSLELKKLQCGQAVAQQMEKVSLQMKLLGPHAGARSKGEKFQLLSKERGKLVEKHEALQKRMSEGSLLSSKEQQKLLALNEQIQVLEAAIEFKNDSILSKKATMDGILSDSLDTSSSHASSSELRNSAPVGTLNEKLKVLDHGEVCALLGQYFRKVVELRLGEGEGLRARQELEVKLAEEVEGRRRAETMLSQVQLEGERALMTQQLENDRHIKFLMQQIHTQEDGGSVATPTATPTGTEELEAKVRALEKDLYYYRKTSRDLKKRLGRGSGLGVGVAEEAVSSAPEMEGVEGGKVKGRSRVKLKRRKDAEGTGNEGGSERKLAGHEIGAVASVSVGSGGNLEGTAPQPPSLPRKDEPIQEAVSIHACTKASRGGAEQPPVKTGGPVDKNRAAVDRVASLDEAAGGSLAPLQVTGLPKQPQQVVKRSRKELRQLSASDLAERQKRCEN